MNRWLQNTGKQGKNILVCNYYKRLKMALLAFLASMIQGQWWIEDINPMRGINYNKTWLATQPLRDDSGQRIDQTGHGILDSTRLGYNGTHIQVAQAATIYVHGRRALTLSWFSGYLMCTITFCISSHWRMTLYSKVM